MIIFGTRGVSSKVGEGNFNCPQCASVQPYKHKKSRRFFTLYFIPLIPLDTLGEYVECGTCRNTFIPRVLEFSPSKSNSNNEFQSIYEQAIKHSAILTMVADGKIEQSELVAVQSIINKFSHHDISLTELERQAKLAQLSPEPVDKYLSKIAPQLNEHGKEEIIKSAVAIALSDGHMDESELALIHEMGKALDMSPSHLKGILSEISN